MKHIYYFVKGLIKIVFLPIFILVVLFLSLVDLSYVLGGGGRDGNCEMLAMKFFEEYLFL